MNLTEITRNAEIERIAEDVLKAFDIQNPPVDVLSIAEQEGIELGALEPGSYSDEFSGRIEYHCEVGKFLLFHPDTKTAEFPTRVRFSIAHELGHYYIPEHRKLLLQGQAHNSQAGFICDNKLEREADQFAGALLLPGHALKEKLRKRGFLTLQEILDLANRWSTSATSAAIRYVKYVSEACAVVVSRDSRVIFYVPSPEASEIGFKFLGHKKIPESSLTSKAVRQIGKREVIGGPTSTDVWFSQRFQQAEMYEEAFPLGYTNLVVTLLAFEKSEK